MVTALIFMAATPAAAVAADFENAYPKNTAPGIIVMSPVSDLTQNHLQLAATFLITGNIAPGTRLSASATLPSGQTIVLREFTPESTSQIGFVATDRSGNQRVFQGGGPTSYPLTGFGLPTASLPFGALVSVRIDGPTVKASESLLPFQIRTTPVIRGV